MKYIRFSLRQMLAATLAAAIFFAGLAASDRFFANLIFTLTIAILLGEIPFAIYRRGAHRAFLFGFEVFGWAYLLFALSPLFGDRVADELITTFWLNDLANQLHRNTGEKLRSFSIIGHCGFLLIIAICGGVIFRSAFISSQDSQPPKL